MKVLPEKTVERLSRYRRTLLRCLHEGKVHIYSHELAKLHNITPVQVRRDIMFINYSGQGRKGYQIASLLRVINGIIDPEDRLNLAVVGYGNLGRAIASYMKTRGKTFEVIAAFDTDPSKIGDATSTLPCYPVEKIEEIARRENITMAILTVPAAAAQQMTEMLVSAGIRGIMNFTTVNIKVPDGACLEEYDMITSLEKLAYFVKAGSRKKP